jgi:hypothetical protein
MERIEENIALFKGSCVDKHGHCIEEGTWPQNLDVNYDDEELAAFFEHAEICPVHREIVKAANSEFGLSLIQFNCRLRASAKPKYDKSSLERILNQAKQKTSERSMEASGMSDLDY